MAARSCFQTPVALRPGPSWGAHALASTAKLAPGHLCHSAALAASCAGRVARGTSGTVRRRRPAQTAGACGALVALSGGDGWRRERATGSTALLPDAGRPTPRSLLGRRPRLPARPNLRQAHLSHSAVLAASCAGRVARGTSGTVRRPPVRPPGACGAGPGCGCGPRGSGAQERLLGGMALLGPSWHTSRCGWWPEHPLASSAHDPGGNQVHRMGIGRAGKWGVTQPRAPAAVWSGVRLGLGLWAAGPTRATSPHRRPVTQRGDHVPAYSMHGVLACALP